MGMRRAANRSESHPAIVARTSATLSTTVAKWRDSPGIGKSTLSALYADRHPGTLNLEVDALHHLIGGWQDEETDTWPVVWSLARAMAATHPDGGRDVVLPQYFATVDEIAGFEELARKHGAVFREVVLLDDRQAAIERFNRRARDSDDPWIRHHHRLIAMGGGQVLLGSMYATT
jgi:hypothetical protein